MRRRGAQQCDQIHSPPSPAAVARAIDEKTLIAPVQSGATHDVRVALGPPAPAARESPDAMVSLVCGWDARKWAPVGVNVLGWPSPWQSWPAQTAAPPLCVRTLPREGLRVAGYRRWWSTMGPGLVAPSRRRDTGEQVRLCLGHYWGLSLISGSSPRGSCARGELPYKKELEAPSGLLIYRQSQIQLQDSHCRSSPTSTFVHPPILNLHPNQPTKHQTPPTCSSPSSSLPSPPPPPLSTPTAPSPPPLALRLPPALAPSTPPPLLPSRALRSPTALPWLSSSVLVPLLW